MSQVSQSDGFIILTNKQVENFGLKTQKGELYLQRFLASKQPAYFAVDPSTGEPLPFKLNDERFSKIIVSAIGKPFLVTNNPK